ncbi:TIGR03086 family metal-binding protein [Streptomyces sp. NPDC004111]|uniref:TIGR03086 family metal-binding protein n=1 Tax=Streptomyces sp. NPDC004111 TaxID=3364690 RepID=UPI00367A7716
MPMNLNGLRSLGEFQEFQELRLLHATAVRTSAALVARVAVPDDLARPTPCADWDLGALLAHMTAQHRGFAAAARGQGADPAHWAAGPPPGADVAVRYAEEAERVIAAFADLDDPQHPCVLPEFGPGRTFPAIRALGFHCLDYVVHGWDVARSLDLPYAPGPELLAAVLPIARAVPGGASRLAPHRPFAPALAPAHDADPLETLLAELGRPADWRSPAAASRTESPC